MDKKIIVASKSPNFRELQQINLSSSDIFYGEEKLMRMQSPRAWTSVITSFLLLAMIATGASATSPTTPPPVRQSIDENGFDLLRRVFVWSMPGVSVGPVGVGGLEDNRGLGFRAGHTITLAPIDDKMVASFGDRSEVFQKIGNEYVPESGSGSTLKIASQPLSYQFISRDGTIVDFANFADHIYSGGTAFAVSRIEYANGLQIIYHYLPIHCGNGCEPSAFGPKRLVSITTNSGYQLKFNFNDYSPTSGDILPHSVTAINNNVDYCDPLEYTCVFTYNWPKVYYTVSQTGQEDYVLTRPDGSTGTFGPLGALVSGARPITATTSLTSDFFGSNEQVLKVLSITNSGITWNYTSIRIPYSDIPSTRRVTITGPGGNTNIVDLDEAGEVVTFSTDALGRKTAYGYDAKWRLTSVTYPEGNAVEYSYDSRGNRLSTTQWGKPGPNRRHYVSESAVYPASCDAVGVSIKTCNQPISTKDSRGNTTDYTYSTLHGGVLTVTGPAGLNGVRPQTRTGYTFVNGAYRATSTSSCQTQTNCIGTSDEVKTETVYPTTGSSIGLPTSVKTSSGDGLLSAITTYAYDEIGNLISVDGPLPGSADMVRMRYDALRRQIAEVGPDPDGSGPRKARASRTTYNLTTGMVTLVETGTMSDPGDWSTFVSLETSSTGYDIHRRPVSTIAGPVGGAVLVASQQSYDALGRVECIAQRLNPAIFGTLPASACALGTAGGFGPDRITKTTYDAAGQVIKSTRAHLTPLQIDELTSTYSLNGQVVSYADAKGNLTSQGYDDFDRMVARAYPNLTVTTPRTSSATDRELWAYDELGLMASWTARGGGTVSYEWDALGRMTRKDRPDDFTDTYFSYDNLGRIIAARDGTSSGPGVTSTWDALGRMTSQTSYGRSLVYQYDAVGRRTRMSWPTPDSFWVDYDYDVSDKILAIREKRTPADPGVLLASFGYDALGRRNLLTRGNGGSSTYQRDGRGRLEEQIDYLSGTVKERTVTLSWSPASQITGRTNSNDRDAFTQNFNVTRPYSTNALNQYTTVGALTFTHDARGNMTSDGQVNYVYDIDNRMTTINGARTATLDWDPLDRLRSSSGSALGTTQFLFDGTDLVAEYDGAGGLTRRYVHGPLTDDPIVEYVGNGLSVRQWMVSDERGSIIALIDASGLAILTNSYDPWGIPGTRNAGRFQYTGQLWLPEIGLYYYKSRMYSPTAGRFMQTDPIGIEGGINLYSYAQNDPLSYRDPMGTYDQEIGGDGGDDDGGEELERSGIDNRAPTGADQVPGPTRVKKIPKKRPRTARLQGFCSECVLASLIPGTPFIRLAVKVKDWLSPPPKATATVIGRKDDLLKLKNLRPGEKSLLDRLPNRGSPKANWSQNAGVLRQEMSRGLPIRDISPGNTSGQFLNAERNLLQSRGWMFDAETGMWNPPQ